MIAFMNPGRGKYHLAKGNPGASQEDKSLCNRVYKSDEAMVWTRFVVADDETCKHCLKKEKETENVTSRP